MMRISGNLCLLVMERSVKSKRLMQHRLTEEMESLKAGRQRKLHNTLNPHSAIVDSRTPSILRPEEQDSSSFQSRTQFTRDLALFMFKFIDFMTFRYY